MVEHATRNDASGDLLALERCPECDVPLRPPVGKHAAGRCAGCGFAYDDGSTWLFCCDVMGPALHGLLLAARAIVGLVVAAAVWMAGGALPGLLFGAVVLFGLAVHTLRHASMRRRDGNRPILICPAGVGTWSASALTYRAWQTLTDVRMQPIHDRQHDVPDDEQQTQVQQQLKWRLTIRGSLWRSDIGGIFRASRREAERLGRAIEGYLNAAHQSSRRTEHGSLTEGTHA